MDRITRSMLDAFLQEESLSPKDEAEAFEHFGNFTIIANEYSEQFDISEVHAGSSNDTGLDGVGIIVNGTLVNDVQEIEDVLSFNNYIDVTFIFIQAKSSSKFETSEFGNFAFGVKDFFAEKPALLRNEAIQKFASLQEAIFIRSTAMTKGKPECKLFYVTTGKWQQDVTFMARIAAAKLDLEQLNLFRSVTIEPIDADHLHALYNNTKNKVKTEIYFENKITLPEIAGIKQSYLGIIPAGEYLKLITDSSGSIRKSLFYDNVRDYQGNNEVNKEIADTFANGRQDGFVILNNGVTIVAKKVQPVGNKFNIEDYQIVNGCQTSHVVFLNRHLLTENTFIPVKVIESSDENVIHLVIKATNRQTAVGIEDLESISEFQKKLESYYQAIPAPNKLYYERRSRQYNDVSGIEKVRIITLPSQLRHFASMFLDEPHRAGRYYGTLLKLIGKKVFLPQHDPISYYTSAFANYKLDTLFRNGTIDTKYKMFRYYIIMALRYQEGGKIMPALTANKIKRFCENILEVLQDSQRAPDAYAAATMVIDKISTGSETRDTVKTQSFTDVMLDALRN